MNYEPFSLPTLSKIFLGAEPVLRTLERAQELAKQAVPNWPFYNIAKTGENTYRIDIAVAGFPQQSLDLTLEDGVLTVEGKLDADGEAAVDYLYKGITGQSFVRRFSLADTIEIQNAELVNGVLKIFLENQVPLKQSHKIDIKSK